MAATSDIHCTMIAFDPPSNKMRCASASKPLPWRMIAPYEKAPRNTPHSPTEDLRIELNGLAREAGLFAPQVPERWGGIELDHVSMAIAFEACGPSPLGQIAMHCAAPEGGDMNLLDNVASEAVGSSPSSPAISAPVFR
ncbi:acyl-CoA dehydrogenase family protein [Citreicella sp. C3M06]|uniref:acyl-CoA dehydrogenase family protein n=1 Tax=Citreicella sp. C3M06 TaxID=2841564 RepID=UPI001EB9CC3F|nr:acyl-CoA dehydrogenase family protein [Citreicella sp. C3M06]MBU2962763.1 acyl-CoA dehydrogenase family protein [Citreicella sp. C3M06]